MEFKLELEMGLRKELKLKMELEIEIKQEPKLKLERDYYRVNLG